MTSKELLSANKDLSRWWATIAHDERFSRVLLHVRSQFMDNAGNPDAIKGAIAFENILTSIGDNEDRTLPMPSAGLDHNIDSDLTRLVEVAEKKESL